MGGRVFDTKGSAWSRAAATGDAAALQLLADEGYNLDAKDARGWTALMMVASCGHASCLLLLLKQGCRADAHDPRRWTAATHAAAEGQERCLRLLAEAGADVSLPDFMGATPAMRAAIGGHTQCLRVLAECRCALDSTDRFGMTALQHARAKCHTDCVKLLKAVLKEARPSADDSEALRSPDKMLLGRLRTGQEPLKQVGRMRMVYTDFSSPLEAGPGGGAGSDAYPGLPARYQVC